MDTIKKTADTVSAAGMGQTPIELSHPIHPSTVHFPIAFLTGAFTLDTLQRFTPGVFPQNANPAKGLLSRVIPTASMISPMSHYINAAGIALSVVSIATGLSELYGMWEGQAKQKGGWMVALKDAYAGDKDDIAATKLKTTITHASMNDITVGIASWNFYKRAMSPDLALPKLNAYASAAVLPLFLYSAYLGGSLVYEYAVGVMRQGESVKIKQMQEKSQ